MWGAGHVDLQGTEEIIVEWRAVETALLPLDFQRFQTQHAALGRVSFLSVLRLQHAEAFLDLLDCAATAIFRL
jgi:hypothetical protein